MRMRVTVKMAIEVDPEVWATKYKLTDYRGYFRNRDIVNDVRAHVVNATQTAIRTGDSSATVSITK